jgi:hypothetical protein
VSISDLLHALYILLHSIRPWFNHSPHYADNINKNRNKNITTLQFTEAI